MIKRALTIAGSDASGGAGIEADLKTFQAFDVYGSAAITAVVAENTTGVQGIFPIPPDFIGLQIESVLDDIGADAIKLGMLFDENIIEVVAQKLNKYKAVNIVVDPVMRAKNGDALLKEEAQEALIKLIFPLSTAVTPNIHEAEAIAGGKIENDSDLSNALKEIKAKGPKNVIIKGGHYGEDAVDYFYDGKDITPIPGKRIKTNSTHGTGCTFSSALTALIARGFSPLEAAKKAKLFIEKAIETAPKVGKGFGPVNHNLDTEEIVGRGDEK
jgi:hydroxymethylpyrimidine/phosphomethylpyrimidine kinase